MLVKHKPVGIVSVTGSLIEDLYIRPDEQNKGYGTELLQFAVKNVYGHSYSLDTGKQHGSSPSVSQNGFPGTGRINAITDELNEIELSLE